MAPKRNNEKITSRTRKWTPWILGISGWVASVFLGVLDLPEKIVSFALNAPEAREKVGNFVRNYERFEGRFSSDPAAWTKVNLVTEDGNHPIDVGDVQLSIEYVGKGEYRGEIHSMHIAKQTFAPWSRIMINGELNAIGNFRGAVWDIVNNREAIYTRFTLSVVDANQGALRLTPWRDDGVFPGELTLWPTDYAMADGNYGERFRDALQERTRNRCVNEVIGKTEDSEERFPVSCFGSDIEASN